MRNDPLPRAEQYTKRHRRRLVWRRVVRGLACVVVFCTTYALILPAITMEKEYSCGLEEHIHTEACYTQVTSREKTELICSPEVLGIHAHTQACYDASGSTVCGYADFVVHKHNASCYDAVGGLICPLPEIAEHIHTDSCYSSRAAGHAHTDACYTLERGKLICQRNEEIGHTHGAECFDGDGNLLSSL